MHAPTRTNAERFGLWMIEARKRLARQEQAKDGYYKDGVRQGGLIAFVRYFWHILEPETEFVDGWPLWALCDHLEAVTRGDITRLLLNVPPGFMKSLLTDVFWPAWEWGPKGYASLRFVSFSYASSLTERDNQRFSDLVTCKEFQELYPHVLIVRRGDTKVSNTRKGWKIASSVGGVGTGERGDRVILDDPHNVKESESEVVRAETVRWFRESMSNRLNDIECGAIIVIMQRVHEDDVAGTILSLGLDYCHLMIPMEYDVDRQVAEDGKPYKNAIGWFDPRYIKDKEDEIDGSLAWPDRFSPTALERTKAEVGPFAWASQYQQTPTVRGGGIFRREWWQPWQPPDGRLFPPCDLRIASLDGAFTEKEENNPSALTVWGIFKNPEGRNRAILMAAWRKHLRFSAPPIPRRPEEEVILGMDKDAKKYRDALYNRRCQPHWGLLEWTAHSCRTFDVNILLIEAKASGISAAQELQNRYGQEGWSIIQMPVKGDKVARALAAQPSFSQAMLYAPVRDWAEMVIQEMENFPKGKYDDLTDCVVQAVNYMRKMGLLNSDEAVKAAEMTPIVHNKKKLQPLYPV